MRVMLFQESSGPSVNVIEKYALLIRNPDISTFPATDEVYLTI
jgi:hypothetical protein